MAGVPTFRPTLKRVRALIDTGAGGECIDDTQAHTLVLPVADEDWMSSVGGRHWAAIYVARIYIPSLNRLPFQRFTGVKLEEGNQWHRVIMGRKFLRQYRVSYDGGTGAVEIVED